jgi:hypothetical protein
MSQSSTLFIGMDAGPRPFEQCLTDPPRLLFHQHFQPVGAGAGDRIARVVSVQLVKTRIMPPLAIPPRGQE